MFAPVIGAWHSIVGFFHNLMMLGIGGVIGFVIGWLTGKIF